MEDLLFVIACCITPLGLAGALYLIWRRWQQRTQSIEATAAALGLEKRLKIPGRLPHQQWWWYEGVWEDGRSVGLLPVGILRVNRQHYERPATRRDPALRLIVEVKVSKPLGVKVMRNMDWGEKRPLDSFESAFDVRNGEKLTPVAQEALLNFLKEQHGTFLLSDRAAVLDRIITSHNLMEETTAVLLHEYEVTILDIETVKAKVASMVALARLFEDASY